MEWWAAEDGPFEYATALIYGICCILFALMARRGKLPVKSMRKFGRTILIVGSIGCFFIMGEEVSWGQRIIGFETPEYWADNNYQQETTLHNLDWIYDNFTSSETGLLRANFFNLIMLGMGFALPLVALMPWVRRLTAGLAIPIIPLRYSVLFLGAWLFGKYLQDYAIQFNTPPEVREFLYAIGIIMFALTGLKRPWEVYRVKPEEISG
jgi:hypothetical protein